jgi:hypothetical protein
MSFEPQEIADAWNLVNKALAAGNGKDQQRIAEVGLCVVGMLLKKNAAYGSSAFEPISIFAKGDALEQIHCRMDDKLARIARGHAIEDESIADTVMDLAGYCVLELIARERQ